MKKFIFLIILASFACKKSHGPSVSHWALGNQSYTATSTFIVLNSTNILLVAADTIANPPITMEVVFSRMPVSGQDYLVVNGFSGQIDSAHCAIGYFTHSASGPNIGGISNGGGIVHVTISSDSKVTASFSNINMVVGNNVYSSLSGVLIQQ